MKDLFEILNLTLNDIEDIIKEKYRQRMIKVHPSRCKSSNEYQELLKAYKEYLCGEDSYNCEELVYLGEKFFSKCRCGSIYDNLYKLGKYECETCSCFILVVEPLKSLN
ncbi:hypothetical protein HERIO_269 [Hepatospora eriocheir]|uniref:J domain-containing protein n=1 Tax=Hepatospora eriocheir TaxID=1081669 RepID=A0A1X0QDM7_9MICR|nr:hypothetical protein HERIO_269 [Hepatospora eriocheir]